MVRMRGKDLVVVHEQLVDHNDYARNLMVPVRTA